ncbi:hypothetical protein A9G45_05080 [Gilliamella sp. HK2]|nr:T6SS immunity protein Tli4 family protein [Gilliamella apicola]OCG28812.1 hypothetical protein A9G46_01855 [Gilliamella apicola]OCG29054.1 hypothetical protein A9G45_05080 [Gilliamella apicola]
MVTLSPEQQQQVDQLLNNTATRCVGVYLIDLPKQFKAPQSNEFYYTYNNEIKIKTEQLYLPPFKQMIALREQELKNTRPVNPINGDFLKVIHPVPTRNPQIMQGIIFERMEKITIPDVARILEGYRWQDDVALKIEIKATNGLASRYDQDRKDYPDIYNNDVPEKLAQMYKLFEHISVRDDYNIPTEPGFCFIYGFMHGGVKEDKHMYFLYRYEESDDFSIDFNLYDYSYNFSLLDVPDIAMLPSPDSDAHTVYKGTRESNQLVMEERIMKGMLFSDDNEYYPRKREGYIFNLGIHLSKKANYKKPRLLLKMHYKIPQNNHIPSYSEEQLMVIWREITNSLRIREGSFADEE